MKRREIVPPIIFCRKKVLILSELISLFGYVVWREGRHLRWSALWEISAWNYFFSLIFPTLYRNINNRWMISLQRMFLYFFMLRLLQLIDVTILWPLIVSWRPALSPTVRLASIPSPCTLLTRHPLFQVLVVSAQGQLLQHRIGQTA